MITQSNCTRLIAITDSRKGLLLRAERAARGALRLETVASHETPAPDREHHRPVLLGGTERAGSVARSGDHAAPHNGAFGHDTEEDLRRGAADLAEWIEKSAKLFGSEEVAVFAPPRLLPHLRDRLSRAATPKTTVRAAELAGMPIDELSRHPKILDAVSAPAPLDAESHPS